MTKTLIQRDLENIWHPCSQMKDYETFPPLEILKAQGSHFELKDGTKIIDAISSWWCKSLGHNHPRLRDALIRQAKRFEHVIFTHTTFDKIVELSEKLTGLTSNLKKVFYAGDGSSAVEVALKMSLHARTIQGETSRTQFAALENSYHGETLGALSVSDVGLYRKPYESHLFPVTFIKNIPYVNSVNDPLWNDCSALWPSIEAQLNPIAAQLNAIIVEPLIQASAGMLMYSKDFLYRLREYTKHHGIYLIADEIMTGLGRLGVPLACSIADIEPDFLLLGKTLTAGWLPMSAVLIPNEIYQLFYDDYELKKSFLHSHTHSGNALAAAVACEYLKILEEENIYQPVTQNHSNLRNSFKKFEELNYLKNIRGLGGVIAGDLVTQKPRHGFQIYQNAVKNGAFLRPLGNTIYWVPPLNTTQETLQKLHHSTLQAFQVSRSD